MEILTENGIVVFKDLKFVCSQCGCVDAVIYTYKSSNKSIQARCGKWIGNVKYDNRPKEQIKSDAIARWKSR